MTLPVNQDLVLDERRYLGPLSDQRLEQIAFDIFRFRFPDVAYYDAVFQAERSECRQIALRMAVRLTANWTLSTANEQLTAQFQHLVFGEREPQPRDEALLRDYAAACLSDLVGLFSGDEKDRTENSERYVPEDEPDDSEISSVRRVS